MSQPVDGEGNGAVSQETLQQRTNSISHASENSQTAAEYIRSQLQLETDAREALPYQFDTCTRPLGALRQSLFSCLTCNPPPASLSDPYSPAGVCYSCSISCHGEHTLVELFSKRNFVCDCGTTRIQSTSPCNLRISESTGQKGNVRSETAAPTNQYNKNFRNRFCGCEEEYDAHQERGTMFQCLGLGLESEGGCGEDWWHPECIVGLGREAYRKILDDAAKSKAKEKEKTIPTPEEREQPGVPPVQNDSGNNGEDPAEDEETPLPAGFPKEEEFESFICYKCVDTFSWIKRYAGKSGFLGPVYFKKPLSTEDTSIERPADGVTTSEQTISTNGQQATLKRKIDDMDVDTADEKVAETERSSSPSKRQRASDEVISNGLSSVPEEPAIGNDASSVCKLQSLPSSKSGQFSIFTKHDFRDHLCRCPSCFPLLKRHPQLLEEEEIYEPPMSDDGEEGNGASVGTGSLLERGEAALSNIDRVRAIEGAMVYDHLKSKVKEFLKPFADSGQAVGAEDIKSYFEKLRGDADAIQDAAAAGASSSKQTDDGKDGDENGGGNEKDGRREQSGY